MENIVPSPREIGKHIAEIRSGLGMSRQAVVEELATYGIHLPMTSFRRIETGEQPIKLHEAFGLSAVFKIDIYALGGLDADTNQVNKRLRQRALHAQVDRMQDEIEKITREIESLND